MNINVRLIPWAIVALYLLFLFPTPEFPAYNKDDSSYFVVMGWNLAHYGRYTVDTYPFEIYGHHGTWPPLFAGILAGVIKVAGLNWMVLKMVMVLLSLGALALLLRLWRNEKIGAWAVLLTALSPAFFLFSHLTMSEVPYILAITATLLALSHAEKPHTAFLAGLLAVAAFFTRGYAVIFLPAGLIYFMLRPWPLKQRLIVCTAYAAPLLIAILVWKGYTEHVIANQPLDWITARYGNGSGMVDNLLRSPKEYLQNIYWHHLRYPAHLILPFISLELAYQNDLSVVLSILLIMIIGYGWLVLFIRRRGAVECWLPLALAFLLIPRVTSARYWLPFLPFLFYYLLYGLNEIGQRFPHFATVTRVFPFILLFMGSGSLAWHLAEPDRLRFVSPDRKDFRDVALWAGENLPNDAVVQTSKAHWFLASSGLSALSVETLPDEIRASGRPLYVLCSPYTPVTLTLCTEMSDLDLVKSQGEHALYRIQL